MLREAGIHTTLSVAPLLPCTPKRLAKLAEPCFASGWVGTMNFYEKEAPLRAIYAAHGWERYLEPQHADNVRAALTEVFTGPFPA
jgi:hypothetical protein